MTREAFLFQRLVEPTMQPCTMLSSLSGRGNPLDPVLDSSSSEEPVHKVETVPALPDTLLRMLSHSSGRALLENCDDITPVKPPNSPKKKEENCLVG